MLQEEVGTRFLGFSVSKRTEQIQCSYYSVVAVLLETYLAAPLTGTRQNRGRIAVWQGLFATWCLPAVYKGGQMASQDT